MYNHKRLQTKHHEILRRAHIGQSNAAIAAELNLSPVTISIILNSSLAKMELLRMRNADLEKTANTPARVKLATQLNEAAELSVQHHLQILRGETAVDERTKVAVSKQHVSEGIYKTESNDTDKLSFRDLIRGLSRLEEAVATKPTNVINITPQK